MLVLNLGCGYRTSSRCVNIDWSLPIRVRSSAIGRRVAPALLRGERRAAYNEMAGDVRPHDLRKGIPYADGSVDAVYHSHMLEHIDHDGVPGFLAEVRRVLKPGGVHRIVVPDLELQARDYLASLDAALAGHGTDEAYDAAVHDLIEQMVRREAYGSSTRPPTQRRLENMLLGDARSRGETHQWMWDRFSLPRELERAGFKEPEVVSNVVSRIPDWRGYLLDESEDGSEYRPGSLYIEASV